MATRFGGSHSNIRNSAGSRSSGDAFGQWWAAVGVISLSVMGVLILGGGVGPHRSAATSGLGPNDVLASLRTAEHALSEIARSFDVLCKEPVLVALELEPDCETGVITLSDDLFTVEGGSQLTKAGQEDVVAAMTQYLQTIR